MWLTMGYGWVEMIVRWMHVIAGIAWIGSSFYFIALDASLKHQSHLDHRVKGETWQVHGGGFYQMQKFVVVPEFMPDELTWFKWEAYATWIFGFALLVLTYYLNPSLYLIDPAVADLTPWDAVAIGLASLGFGWLIYDGLCRSWFGNTTPRLALSGFLLLVAVEILYSRLYSGRGAFIHVGALVGSIMVGNVFFTIIPGQRKIVADLMAGREPDPALGARAKQRSVHNNYLTLPVIFTMISNHYPFVYASRWNWVVLSAVFIGTFLIRHWFNVKHTGEKPDWRLWPAGAVPIALAALLTVLLQPRPAPRAAGAEPVHFAQVQDIIGMRCHVCHTARPSFPGITAPPKGIMFDSPAQIVRQAPLINAQAVAARAMPMGNATNITEDERAALGAWIAAGAHQR
jgi:uncharacterized membrane protein